MDRFVVMVDAGYLLRQSIEIVSKRSSTKRGELDITDPAGLVGVLLGKCRSALNLGNRELLRFYWYDGVMATGLTVQQRSIIDLPDVHFRAGIVNRAGKQKGVDSLIVTDLIELASNHAICDAALVTGDSDLAVGIEIAQKKGVRIAVIGIEDLSDGVSHKQSFEITSRADRIARLGGADLTPVMRYTPHATTLSAAPNSQNPPPGTPQQPTASVPAQPPTRPANTPLTQTDRQLIEESVKTFVEQQASLSGAVDPATKRIDSTVDRALIHHVFVELAHGRLTDAEKIYAREALKSQLGF